MTGALIASTVVGGVTAYSSSKRSASAAKDARDLNSRSTSIQQRQLEFDKMRYMDAQMEYDKWRDIYGPLQEDLATYYRNLTGSDLSDREISDIQAASQASQDKIRERMALNGQSGSGLESYLLSQNDYSTEASKAASRSTAEDRVMGIKSNFLSVGLNQANALRNSTANIAANISNDSTRIGAGLNRGGAIGLNEANTQNQIWNSLSGGFVEDLGFYGAYNDGLLNKSGIATAGATL